MFEKPIINRRRNGEYSTIQLPGGMVETCWFPEDPNEPSQVIDRSYAEFSQRTALIQISEWEAKK